jgi:2-iminobutanoate/2-iminopropanoate deaminase
LQPKKIESGSAPEALGPYSQAIAARAGAVVWVSGQLGIDPAAGSLVAGGVGAQTEQAIKNVFAIVEAAGGRPASVVKTTVYLRHLEDFGEMNDVYARLFAAPYPARACIGVAALPKDGLVEIEAIAVVEETKEL